MRNNIRWVFISIVSDDVDGWYRFITSKGVRYVKNPSYSDEFKVYSSLFYHHMAIGLKSSNLGMPTGIPEK